MNTRTVEVELLPLQSYLKNLSEIYVALSFYELEIILSEPLPHYAYEYHAWWVNSTIPHSHASTWLDAGYEVTKVKLGDWVEFRKNRHRASSSASL